jgi:hypothetical protein
MSRGFFNGNEEELFTRSKAFAEKIVASPELYGLTPEIAAAYAALDLAWREAFLAARSPLTRTQARVRGKSDLKAAIRKRASLLSQRINSHPTVTDEMRNDLGLAVRGKRSPLGPPGTPEAFRETLNGGMLILKWKCKHPRGAQGTIYEIWRQIDDGPTEFLGSNGKKTFTDATVPAGSARIVYKVRAMRSTDVKGPWGTHVVQFGGGGVAPGEMQMKDAA